MIRFSAMFISFVVVQVHMPTRSYKDEVVREIYEEIDEVSSGIKGMENLI